MLCRYGLPLVILITLISQAELISAGPRDHNRPSRHSRRQWSSWFSNLFGNHRRPSFTQSPTQPAPAPEPATQPSPVDIPASKPVPVPAASPKPSPPTTSTAPPPTTPVQSAPKAAAPGTCSEIRVRKEWRSFSRQEQINYITAVKCLTRRPSKLLPGGTYRRYDDFQNVHSRMRAKIHWIAPFFPWHRNFMFLWEKVLRDECGYAGNLPRWDWTLDSDDMTKAPIWSADPQTGFGTNGQNFTNDPSGLGGGTVEDGAFANLQLFYPDPHLLERNYNLPTDYESAGRTWGSQFFDQAAVDNIQSQTTYQKFAVSLEGTDPSSQGESNPGPHSIIHVIIGGDISPTTYAANEPLFYLHHTNVDYHWAKWQKAKRSRLTAYGGITVRGSTTQDAKSSDKLNFLSLGPNPTVLETMDTTAYPYCYTYE